MRSFSRAVVVGALTLPLAFAGAGLASATDDAYTDGVCGSQSCNWGWDFDTTAVSDDDQNVINTGITG